jgi:hypothetical protein
VSRPSIDYRQRRASAHAIAGYDASIPNAGWYRYKLRAGGHPVAVRIWFGAPHDPVTGEELDRGWRWQATANGEPIDLDRVWPSCGRDPITECEGRYLAGLQAWATEHAPASPAADPNRRIDLLTAPMPF